MARRNVGVGFYRKDEPGPLFPKAREIQEESHVHTIPGREGLHRSKGSS